MFDLSDLQSVRDWTSRALDFGHALDVLVNNAGARVCVCVCVRVCVCFGEGK